MMLLKLTGSVKMSATLLTGERFYVTMSFLMVIQVSFCDEPLTTVIAGKFALVVMT
jgi:hypothetical protein